ncbi:hypothetical protein FNW02_35660 [Komarekiella sp. 'clone 1']|uniref:Uncharacterized protein n=1 Tax=Komarekiella delphini-convector SJRDD-AB1 TaxID=2593771 RepID=A0AA40VV56_9NOST|nr:hypothetical protein [Komarekiella delphini-convector]MBD6620924.1 hypothetical protein [Komarekiella delphini-convector SJRDD-AB1]
MSTNYQFYCRDFWLPIDYESNKDGESFIFADDALNLSIAAFSVINYCLEPHINSQVSKYESLVNSLAFPLELYGEKFDFLSINNATVLLKEINNKYSWELTCWLQNYIYPEWKRQGLRDIPYITNSSILFKPSSKVLCFEFCSTEV